MKQGWPLKMAVPGLLVLAAAVSMAVPAYATPAPGRLLEVKGYLNGKVQLPAMKVLLNGCWDQEILPPDFEWPAPGLPSIPGQPGPDIPSRPDIPGQPDDVPPQEEPGAGILASYASQVAALVNSERENAGLPALAVDVQVQSAAQVRAQELPAKFSHTRPDGTSCFTALAQADVPYRGAGENIARGQKNPAQVMQGWMNSSGHRANILNSSFESIGIGVYQDASGTLYWAQMFTY